MSIDYVSIPIFIISFNRLEYLKKLISWLEFAGHTNITIVDNASDYPPLLNYLETTKHKVVRMSSNLGHLVVWDSHNFDEIITNQEYIVSDCDVLPIEDCPKDAVKHFYEILTKYPNINKVGFSLKIDDIPDSYSIKKAVIEHESNFWTDPVNNLYFHPIDTTFAIYRPNVMPSSKEWWSSIRCGHPYSARHLPWYEDENSLSEELMYYQAKIIRSESWWSVTDRSKLINEIIKLKNENAILKSDLENFIKSKNTALLRKILYFISHVSKIGK